MRASRSVPRRLLAGLSLAPGAIAADFKQQPPIAHDIPPGYAVAATADPDVFVLTSSSINTTTDGSCPAIELRYWTGSPSTVCPCFAVGEQAGVAFVAPPSHYPLDILSVTIAWGTAGPECDPIVPDLQGAINIWRGMPPNLGNAAVSLEAPGLTCGVFNQFDLPAPLRVNSGPFTAALEFDEGNAGNPFARSVVHDGNGCQSGKNWVLVLPQFQWRDACSIGVSGDWAIEVRYRRVSCSCPGDVNGDHTVGFADLNIVLGAFGAVGQGILGDVNGDGVVNFQDLNIVLSFYGSMC